MVKVKPLVPCWVSQGVKEVRCVRVVVRRPFLEVVRDVKGCRVWGGVFEVYDDDLG